MRRWSPHVHEDSMRGCPSWPICERLPNRCLWSAFERCSSRRSKALEPVVAIFRYSLRRICSPAHLATVVECLEFRRAFSASEIRHFGRLLLRNQSCDGLPAVGDDDLTMSNNFPHPSACSRMEFADRYGFHV